MDNKRLIIFGLFFIAVSLGTASQTVSASTATVYVNSGTGNDAWDGSSPTYTGANHGPDKTITGGLDDVFSGGTINVAHGIYQEHITITKSVTINGASPTNTIIDGTHDGRIITIPCFFLVNINHMTLKNGKSIAGGAIQISVGSSLTVEDCTFTSNTATKYSGGAIDFYGDTLNIKSSKFTSNTANTGGAIYNTRSCLITGSEFTSNTANHDGGAISNTGTVIITGSKFTSNTAKHNGGAISNYAGSSYAGSVVIHSSLIIGNSFEEIHKESGSTVDATYNWWGSDADPSGRITDGVLVSPWIKSPKVTTTSPKNKAKKISRTKTIVLTFSSNIKSSSAYNKITVRKNGVKVTIKKKWINGNKLYIQTKKRSKNKYYTITVPVNAIKNTYNINLQKPYTFKFKTK